MEKAAPLKSLTDDELVEILDDLDWKHYAALGPPPVFGEPSGDIEKE